MTTISRPLHSPRLALLLGALALASAFQVQAAPLSIAQVPLYLGGTVEPNVMFILDDSGSMAWSFMPDDIYGYYNRKGAQSSTYNSLYYNPNVTYTPPLDENGNKASNASFTAAWWDGYSSTRQYNTVNLSTSFRPTWYYPGYSTEYSNNTAQPAFYYVFDRTNSGCFGSLTDDDCYDKVVVSSTSGPGNTDERTNFANWYSYYRTRLMSAKAGISRAFGIQGTGLRVGYGRINKGSTSIDGLNFSTLERGVRDFSDVDSYGNTTNYRKSFFDWLYAVNWVGNTPLRKALDDAGRYYERNDSQGPASTTPGVSGGNDLSCRQNYTILMTDGYWNSSAASTSAARQNNDGTDGTAYTDANGNTVQFRAVAPFADNYSDTLADIAAYYWKRDLRTDLTNDVPANADDPAFWQHMVTFGVGLGVEGNVTPSSAFSAISTQSTINWGDPSSSNPAKIDDLLHAAVNSRGDFFSAKDPQSFANALATTLATINTRTSSAAAVSTNSTYLGTDTLVFQALFSSDGWTGDMLAYEIEEKTSATGVTYYAPKSAPKWKASNQIGAASGRDLLTWNTVTNSAISFRWASLNATQQAALGSSDLLDFIRGDQTKEEANGGSFRDRYKIIGDVVNSSPAYVGTQNYGYAQAASLTSTERAAYRNRRGTSSYINREPALFFGANDGILHVVKADTGDELFGYIPNAIIGNLPDLADPDYTHRYYVDGSPVTTDAILGGSWKSVLVGSTGAGGKAYFALDVENAANFSASNVLWEVSNTTAGFSELGYTMGQAAVGRTENGKWVAIVGNGYNSTSQTARLFVIDLATGALLKELDTGVGSTTTPNGLSSPIAIDANRNGSIDLVYAGDLYGNIWKFDFTTTNSTSNGWKIAFSGKPLFQAKYLNSSNVTIRQPITTRPQVGVHSDGGFMVYFGTGKYFETGDNTDLSLQTLYGVRDECGLTVTCTASGSSKVSRSDLLKQEITYEGTNSFNGNSWDVREFSQNQPNNTQKGFYVDLVYNANYQGERVLATPILWSDRVIYVTAIPDDDSCNGGGESWIIELAPETGGRTTFNPFDLAKDGTYGASSQINKGTAINGRKVKGGMIGGLGQMQAKDGKRLKIGSTSSASFDTSLQEGEGGRRISWRQIQ
ncbi:hypothetical protein G3580_05755 [Nitrogeniibacter mangrovi]|uniref:PilY1 beta-propeller domain-containing protein n=1 Tax=Nitrogeniibacter mangrovi TaxID=2016596 RepID=A0A6C1B0P8_9RHOO|nr:PilC/PilY family type IV pilus protein [Nitrogeniibacter mangrovi]QID17191.1 hypothetical protein G3580_05755 [Nitrogeniibacter mangrovi]